MGEAGGEPELPWSGAHSIPDPRALARAGLWVLGRGGGEVMRARAQRRGSGVRGRGSPNALPPPSTTLPEAAERAGAVPGVGGEEAGPPHWLLSAPPARSQRERSFGQLRGAGAGAQRSPLCPRSGLTGSRALPREADDGGRCRRMRHGPAAPAAAFAAPRGEC